MAILNTKQEVALYDVEAVQFVTNIVSSVEATLNSNPSLILK